MALECNVNGKLCRGRHMRTYVYNAAERPDSVWSVDDLRVGLHILHDTARYHYHIFSGYITQYHALGLLYLIRQQDRMAVTKMIQQLGGGKSGAGTSLKNPMALCMLIRYASKVMEDDPKYVL